MLVAEEAVEIRVLSRQGKSIREIARTLEVSRNTVRRYVCGDGLPHYQRETRPSKLDDYKQYIAERVRAAVPEWIPATVLLRELRSLGYAGDISILKDHLATLKPVAKLEPLIRFETDPGRQMQADFATIRRARIGWRCSSRHSAGAAQPSSSSSPMSAWRRCSAATSARSITSAAYRVRCCTTTCGRS
jgi:transposase